MTKRILVLTHLLLILTACEQEHFFFKSAEIGPEGWEMSSPREFSFSTTDTTSYLDFYLDIRNNDDYPYRNIYAFVEMEFPNGKTLTDTIHFPYMATPEGKWTGKGIGSTYDNSILYKQRKKLPLTGDYKVEITHAMRDSSLKGIERVGIHIENSSGN